MRYLSQIILFTGVLNLMAQSPHGDHFNVNCEVCHTAESWDLISGSSFNHDSTRFALTGQHREIDCRMCHVSLVFKEAKSSCVACHSDIHRQTVGSDCDQCHGTNNWIVSNINEVHQMSRFPLYGAHLMADCFDCHRSAALLQFDPMGIDCYDCHQQDFASTSNPPHEEANFSKECIECHTIAATTWNTRNIDHNFFPLTQGHDVQDCKQCHNDGLYTNTSAECKSCHTEDYQKTSNPSHVAADLSLECDECHSTLPGWSPAIIAQHDANWFPIYSGTHNGEWNNCSDCHTVANDFTQFDCTSCHEHNKTDMDEEHHGISGYHYNSASCYACHPNGSSEGAFNHDLTQFPLTGAHRTTDCLRCHTNGYANTPMECSACHMPDYIASQDPPHQVLGFPTECNECHTTQPGWSPASFGIHDNYYPLRGAHALISNECKECHESGYINTPNNCYGCHSEDYAGTTNPSHVAADFSKECNICHNENSWVPSTFNHDDFYPLQGAHALIASDCKLCHINGYENTPTECSSCHINDYNHSVNPPHASAKFPLDCEFCHNQNAWEPSSFNHDGQYFPIYSGTHRGEWSTCADCHTNSSNFAVFACTNCHEHNKTSTDRDHREVRNYVYNSVNCLECHPSGRN